MTDDPKPALRQLYRAMRAGFVASLSKAEREQLERQLALVAAPATRGFHTPGSYSATGDEIDPHVIEHAFASTAFPRIDDKTMTFRRSHWADLKSGYAGILEPSADMPQVVPDMLLVPLVAIMLDGTRLGQGQGHYDKALAALRQFAPVRTIGIAWDIQIADLLPREPWDIPVDFIATPTRLVDCRALR